MNQKKNSLKLTEPYAMPKMNKKTFLWYGDNVGINIPHNVNATTLN